METRQHKNAFTLAEVLVTLTIIGVIASMAIPTLLQSTQNAELKTAWKQNYAILSQTVNKLQLDTGSNLEEYSVTMHSFETELKPYIQMISDSTGDLLYPQALITTTYKDMSGNPVNGRLMDDGQFIMNNGALVMIENYPPYNTPLMLWVDVNGFEKGPNILGKDLYGAEVVGHNRLLPMGANSMTQVDCPCSKAVCQVTKWPGYGALNLAGAGCSSSHM